MVGEEWDRLEAGTLGDEINPWGSVMFETMVDVEPESNAEQSAYDRWLDQTNAREQARNDRVHAVSGVIPSPLWIVLLFVSGVIFLYMLFFADSAERATTQALLMGSVVSVITTLLLLLVFFNQPFQDDVGRAAAGLDGAGPAHHRRDRPEATGIEITAPCDDRARPSMAEPSRTSGAKRLELAATVLLAVAAVATAWSSYQANRWNGEQAKAASQTNAIRIDAARAQGEAQAETEVDVALFIQWVDADAHDEEELADFYASRFRDEFQPAFDAWLATDPFDEPRRAARRRSPCRSTRSRPRTRPTSTTGRPRCRRRPCARDIQRATNYVLAVVLFAVALFFAGISTKLDSERLRAMLLVVGWVVFLGTVAWIATFPISFAV